MCRSRRRSLGGIGPSRLRPSAVRRSTTRPRCPSVPLRKPELLNRRQSPEAGQQIFFSILPFIPPPARSTLLWHWALRGSLLFEAHRAGCPQAYLETRCDGRGG